MNSYALRIREEIKKIPIDHLIISSELYKKKFNYIPENTYYKILQRLCEKGLLTHESKGIYCRPLVTKHGCLPITENEIIEQFTSNKKGMVIGYELYCSEGITTQTPATIQIYSNNINDSIKKIKNVIIIKNNISYSENIKKAIAVLEIIQNFERIEDANFERLNEFVYRYSKEYDENSMDIVLSKIKYKKSTIASLKSFLDFYHVNNNLKKYLSSLSKYKILNIRSTKE